MEIFARVVEFTLFRELKIVFDLFSKTVPFNLPERIFYPSSKCHKINGVLWVGQEAPAYSGIEILNAVFSLKDEIGH